MRRVKKQEDRKKASLQSTAVLERRRAARELAASLAALGDTAAASLEKRLATVLVEGEEMPDVRLLLRLLERLAERAGDELGRADGDRFVRAMRLKVLQEETRRARAQLRREVVRVRKALVDLYGSARVRFQFGLGERTPRGTADVADEGRRLAACLGDPELALPAPPAAGLTPDPESWARCLKPLAERLELLLAERERRRVGAGDGVIEQRRAIRECGETCGLVARTAEALFRLGGEQKLARRLRPKRRARRQRPAIVRAAAGWWLELVAAVRRLRGGARHAEAALRWAQIKKAAVFRLARRFPRATNR